MEKGWVKLYRRVLKNSFLMNDNNAYLVFTKLLMLASQEKGQWSGGRMQLGEITNLNPNTLKDVLKRLENNGMIKTESMKRYSIITIQKWSNYQNKPNGGEQRRTPRLTPLGQQRSFDQLTPERTPMRHHRDTNATPLYKELRIKKEENIDHLTNEEENRRASLETVARVKAELAAKGILKRKEVL